MIRTILTLLVIGNAVAATTRVFAQPTARETWHRYLADDGTAFGNSHSVVAPTRGGNWMFSSSSRTLVDFLGAQRQELTSQTTVVVTADYRLVSIDETLKQLSGTTRRSAVVAGDNLLINVNRSGVAREYQIRLDDELVPDICLTDWISDQPSTLDHAAVRVINSEDGWSVVHVDMRRDSTIQNRSKWHIDFGGLTGSRIIEIGDDEPLEKSTDSATGMRIVRTTEKKAGEIQYLKMDGRSVLMFPVNKDISNPSRIEEMTVKLTWKNIDLDEFNLEDNRQKILTHSESGGEHLTVVQIRQDSGPRGGMALPITDPQFSKYLSETRFIKPDDKEIRRVARQIVTGNVNADQAVHAISNWVFKNIKAMMIVETLSGPEVLIAKKGKCSEYAILFASLTRSVGIPTRIVLGERLVGGHWIGHMWNEVYVGRRITVDASADEVGNSPALLKFVHSDTVMGTQKLRHALTNSLTISIDELRMRETGIVDSNTGIDGVVYTNVDYQCRIAAPDDSWELVDKSKSGVVTVQFQSKENPDVHVYFVAFGLPKNADAKSIVDGRINVFKSKFKDRGLEFTINKPCEVNGAKGHTITYQRQWPDDPDVIAKSTEYLWRQGDFGYLLNINAAEKDHDAFMKPFVEILQSFRHLKPTD